MGAEGIPSTLGAEVFNASGLRLPLGHLTLSPMMVADDRAGATCREQWSKVWPSRRGATLSFCKRRRNGSVQSIRLAGGMSKSTFFAQLLADVLGAG